MTDPFTAAEGGAGFAGFGFAPGDRREMKAFIREQARAHGGSHGRGHRRGHGGPPFGPGFGAGFGPGFNFGFGFGPGGGGPRGRGRGRRGDVRTAILALLTERPMHGYEMIQEIGERSNGLWRPSPGSVYPTLQLLVDEGLIAGIEAEGSKRLFELTDTGREAAAMTKTPPWEEIADGADPNDVNLRSALGNLAGALFQASHAASPEQQKRVLEIINTARRDIYTLLGETE